MTVELQEAIKLARAELEEGDRLAPVLRVDHTAFVFGVTESADDSVLYVNRATGEVTQEWLGDVGEQMESMQAITMAGDPVNVPFHNPFPKEAENVPDDN